MKLDALDHPKTLDFASRLDISRPTAIGHLELFWHFVAKHAPQGNIGKFPDGSIARACDWLGDPASFLKSLLKSGFLDESEAHRYLVHDWSEHCPNWVRAQLQKLKKPFLVTEVRTNEPTEDGSYEGTGEPSTRGRVSKGREGKGREAKPSQGNAREDFGDNSVDNVDNSKSGNTDEIFSDRGDPPSDPSPRNGADRRNADFEGINDAVFKLLDSGVCKPLEFRDIAKLAHISTKQAEIAVGQLRDRGLLPGTAS